MLMIDWFCEIGSSSFFFFLWRMSWKEFCCVEARDFYSRRRRRRTEEFFRRREETSHLLSSSFFLLLLFSFCSSRQKKKKPTNQPTNQPTNPPFPVRQIHTHTHTHTHALNADAVNRSPDGRRLVGARFFFSLCARVSLSLSDWMFGLDIRNNTAFLLWKWSIYYPLRNAIHVLKAIERVHISVRALRETRNYIVCAIWGYIYIYRMEKSCVFVDVLPPSRLIDLRNELSLSPSHLRMS